MKYAYETPEGARGHEWRLEDNGAIDIFGLDADFHNGPICVRCGYAFCHHCQDTPDKPCDCPSDA